jgi:hypothetical protein
LNFQKFNFHSFRSSKLTRALFSITNFMPIHFLGKPYPPLNVYEQAALYYLFLKFLYIIKYSKIGKVHCFLLKNWILLFIPNLLFFFFLLNNTKKKSYANVLKMFNFNLKTSIRKYRVFCSCYNFYSANVSGFYMYFTDKN